MTTTPPSNPRPGTTYGKAIAAIGSPPRGAPPPSNPRPLPSVR